MDRRGRVLVVTMQREAKRNAVDRQLADELDAALNLLDDDPDLWVGVLTGTPNVFSAGSDMTAAGDNVTERGGEYGIIRRVRRTPLVAAVEGPALGGGMEIVLACDLVVASTSATFGLPEVARGLVATSGALFRAARLLPVNLAREMLLTGEPHRRRPGPRRRAGQPAGRARAAPSRWRSSWPSASRPTGRSRCRRAWRR